MIHTCWASPQGTQHLDTQNIFERFLNLSIFALRCEGLSYDVICDRLNLWPGDPRRTNKAVQCLSRYCERHGIKRPRDPKRPAAVARVRKAPYALEQAEAWARLVDSGATTVVALANTEGLSYSCVWNAVTRARRRLRRL